MAAGTSTVGLEAGNDRFPWKAEIADALMVAVCASEASGGSSIHCRHTIKSSVTNAIYICKSQSNLIYSVKLYLEGQNRM